MSQEDQKPEIIRTFIAAPLTDEVVGRLKATVILMKKSLKGRDIRWVPSSNYHITLAFLGNVPALDIPRLEAVMAEAALKIGPFPVEIGSVDLFPDRKKARLLVAEVHLGDRLEKLQAQLSGALVKAGYQVETRKFRPHITIARMKKPIRLALQPDQNATALINQVDMIHLYKSDLQPTGVVNSILSTHALI